jgi:mannitol-1-phosphate 5-dehydrogenase
MRNKKILIYGAGAIGRGFLAPIFSNLGYSIYFVDKNPDLINEMKSRNSYKTAFVKNSKYEIINVEYSGAFLLGEEDSIISSVDMVFSCVGPRNVSEFAHKLKKAKSIISFENEIESVEIIKNLSGNKNCFFGIPDVISSNSACSDLLNIDSLCLISENGELVIEKGNFDLPSNIITCSSEELKKYWCCKFYLHNLPHAAAAFLGKLNGLEYLHQSMSVPKIRVIVESVMESMKRTMKIKKMADSNFIDYYSQKEINRFQDHLLFDPISRVGRDPLRKLGAHDRLIHSAKLAEECGQDTSGICLVIRAAIYDVFKNYLSEARETLNEEPTVKAILNKISNLEERDILFNKIMSKSNLLALNC